MKPPIILSTHNLTKKFGGLLANNNINLQLAENSIHALLGPNGAGKSTCINMLSGDLLPTSGQIIFAGLDISRKSAAERSQLGLGRSYQRTNIFSKFTVFENVRLAAQSRCPKAWKIWENVIHNFAWREVSEKALSEVGLLERVNTIAGALSHGEKRQLEIAMVLATGAKVLLLDEPLAGMGAEESQVIINLLLRLKQTHSILLVEHDMDAVFAVADTITVMVSGEVLESGDPEIIQNSSAVQSAYLGNADQL